MPEVAVSLPYKTSTPTNPRATKPILGDLKHSFLLNFTLPPGGREYRYGIPTTMMTNLQTNAYTYAYNLVTIASPFNPYLASGFAISNPSRMAQSQRGLGYIPQGMSPLTTNTLYSVK